MDAISGMSLRSILPANLPNLEPALDPIKSGKIPAGELGSLGGIGPVQHGGGVQEGRPFYDFLGEMVRDVNSKQIAAGDAAQGVLTGQKVPLHSAMLAIEEASISFQLMVEVRNKLMESYQELMRMQI